MKSIHRRDVLLASTALASTQFLPQSAAADVPAGRDPFDYEVVRTEEEWRTLLGDSFPIMREGKTERQYSSDIWAEGRPGRYECKGCNLVHYTGNTKVNLPKGWLFFTASEPNSQLMSQDSNAVMGETPNALEIAIEVHCRRCGSHIGHILKVEGRVLHCINGASLNFVPGG